MVTGPAAAAAAPPRQIAMHLRTPRFAFLKHLGTNRRGNVRQYRRTIAPCALQARMHRLVCPSAGGTIMLVKIKQQRNTDSSFCLNAIPTKQ